MSDIYVGAENIAFGKKPVFRLTRSLRGLVREDFF